eukprot:723706-Prorocentrum_lima.AAC.1
MTSSLVGSEMCIRDSPFSSPTTKDLRVGVLTRPSVGQMEWLGEQTELPVSYTHLTLPTICSV